MNDTREEVFRRTRLALLPLLFAACTQSGGSGVSSAPLSGTWGGDHLRLELTSAGGSAEYDCAHGGVRQPIAPDARGRFDVPGVHVREHGGPARDGERPDSISARFVGRVGGDRMTVRVLVGALPDTLGPFDLTRGAEARILKCL